ncbi:DUF5412 family protein [Paenibacillus xylanilyticus]|uniref:Uncharacterized protein n=1 Tax=Paenibacillus xylanilyticus TaxID=248903 RepID=A0A7Y6EXR2_9BACL|nr:DUF5412 family protein [Paenibacillus xylanilyticus]NUU77725.1 hypothetical protein [Paenibacillus xylanilyticus]
MVKKMSWIALLFVLILYFISFYSLYSHMNNQWLIVPPTYVMLVCSILVLALAILGFKDQSDKFAKLRSWISTILSSVLIFLLIVVVSFTTMFSGSKELLTITHSPDQHYTLKFYKTDAGAMGTFGVVGELQGPLWFKKVVYSERKVDQVDLEWSNNHTILINDHRVNLQQGEIWSLQ